MLDLAYSQLSVAELIPFFETLKIRKDIMGIRLSSNRLGFAGAVALADVLKFNNNIVYSYIS